jgi:hypothetical protein
MTTQEEIIKQQQELIKGYKKVMDAYTNSHDRLYEYISRIHELLLTEDPVAVETAMTHIKRLAAKAKQ